MPSLTIPLNVPCQHLWASSKLKPDNTYHSDIWECSGCGIDVVHNRLSNGDVAGWRPKVAKATVVVDGTGPWFTTTSGGRLVDDRGVPKELTEHNAVKGQRAMIRGDRWNFDGQKWMLDVSDPGPFQLTQNLADHAYTQQDGGYMISETGEKLESMKSANRVLPFVVEDLKYKLDAANRRCAEATDGIAVLRKLYDEQRVHAMHMADELGNVSRDNRMLTIENSDLRREIDRLKRKK